MQAIDDQGSLAGLLDPSETRNSEKRRIVCFKGYVLKRVLLSILHANNVVVSTTVDQHSTFECR